MTEAATLKNNHRPGPRRIGTRPIRRAPAAAPKRLSFDVCVAGSGAAGISAALEAARLGNKVAIIESSPVLGGQAVNSLVGTFCGFYSNGPRPYRVVYGIASELIDELGRAGALRMQTGRNTIIHIYDELALSRWVERNVDTVGATVILGATIREVVRTERRIDRIIATTRFGDVVIEAEHYIDASGDAALCWLSGLQMQESAEPIRGTQMMTLEGVDNAQLSKTARNDINARVAEAGGRYGIVRRDGFAFAMPAPGVVLVNMTHTETPLDPIGMSAMTLTGRAQAERVFAFLRAEFPTVFGRARVRSYGLPGIRQTRMIHGMTTLTADQVRQGVSFDDAVARCAWPIELHDSDEESYWEEFGDGHMHYVPFGSMVPSELDNVIAAGRCIDADPVALSSVRVIGPCIAMGAAAAHACDLAGSSPLSAIDIAALHERIRDNLFRTDAAEVAEIAPTKQVANKRKRA
jgi:ribulose 1,5-bisphosphate synthetase/thiazole synthase